MAEKSPMFKLRMAKSYVDEVVEGRVSETSAIGSLDSAIKLASEAAALDPDIKLEDGTNAQDIVAEAYLRLGIAWMARAPNQNYVDPWHRAQDALEESHKRVPAQRTLLYIAMCMVGALRVGGAAATTIRKFGGGTIYYHSLLRSKPGKQYIKEFLDQVIDMDPDSEAAVEAGKLLMQLK